LYSTPPWPSLAASMAAYRRRSFSDNHPKKRCIFSSISAEYPSMLDSLSQNLCCRKDTTAQACREVILDHILNVRPSKRRNFSGRDMPGVLSRGRFVAAVVLTRFGVFLRTMLGTCGGVNEDVITPLHSSLPSFWGAPLALRPQC